MSTDEREHYRRLLDADRRYSNPYIRDEVVLRTACGCEKIVSMPRESHIHQQLMQIDRDPPQHNIDWSGNVTYQVRRFIYEGQQDTHGRRVFQERIERQEPWEQRYKDLYNDVYGMDKGL